MPSFAGELSLEFCDVETKAVSREEVERAARASPRDPRDWYLTLRRSDDEWIDATMDDETRFGVRYREAGKTYSTVASLDEAALEALFVSFFEHDGAWKRLCEWKEVPKKKGFSLKNLFR